MLLVNNMSWSFVVAPVGISSLQLSVAARPGMTFWHNIVVRDRAKGDVRPASLLAKAWRDRGRYHLLGLGSHAAVSELGKSLVNFVTSARDRKMIPQIPAGRLAMISACRARLRAG